MVWGYSQKKHQAYQKRGRSPFATLESDNIKKSQPRLTPKRLLGFSNEKKEEAKKLAELQKSEKLTNIGLERQREGEKTKKDAIALLDLQKEVLKIDGLNIDQTDAEYEKVKQDILGSSSALYNIYMEAYRVNLTDDEENQLKKQYPELDSHELKRKKLEQILRSGATDETVNLKTGEKTTTMNKTRLELLSNRLDQLRGIGEIVRMGVTRAGSKSAIGQTITSDGMMNDSAIRSFATRIGDNVNLSDKGVSKIPNFAVVLQSMTPDQKNYLLTITDKKQLKKEFERLDKIKNMKEGELIKQRKILEKKLLELDQKSKMSANPEDLERLDYAKRIIDDFDTMIQLRNLQAKVGETAIEGLPDWLSSVRGQREIARQVRDNYDISQSGSNIESQKSNINIEAEKRRQQLLSLGIVT